MSQFIGRDIELGVAAAEEASSATHSIQKSSANLYKQVETVEDETTRGSIISGKGRRVVQEYVEGSVEGNLHADACGYFFKNIWGSVSSEETATDSGAYEHTFTLDDDHVHEAITLFLKEGDREEELTGVQLDTFELSAAPDSYVTFSSDVIGLDLDDGSFTPDYKNEIDFIGKDVTITIADSKSDLDTEDATEVTEVTVSQERNLERYHVLGSNNPKKIYGPSFVNEITLTKEYLDETFKDLHENDESKFVRITIEGDQDISDDDSSVNAKIEMDFYKAQVMDWSKSVDNDSVVEEEVTLQAFYNIDETENLGQVTVINNTEDYTSA